MTPRRTPFTILPSCLAWLLAIAIFQVAPAMENPDTDSQRLEERILSLIEQLGHDNFNRREFAQRKLRQLGLTAYDAVHRAQQHDDIEVAKRARYLVRSMRIQWSREYDPAMIRRILVGYGDRSPEERRNRMEELASQDQGQLVLCRMVRYESTSPLSKYAALLIIQQERPADESQASALAARLHDAVRQSAQTAAGWIRVHAKTLEDPESALDQWEQICRQEETTLTQFPRETSREITRDLLREYATLLETIDRKEQSLAVLRRTINLLDGTSKQLLEMVDWLVDNEAWSLVQDVAERFPSEFSRNPFLIYRLAESHLREGDPQQADEVAARARAIDPENTRAHTLIAIQLQKQNLVRWSIEEFRLVLEKADLKSQDNLYARFLLSEMLHDQEKEVEAASVLEGAMEAVKDERVQKHVEQVFGRTPAGITSRRLYFLAIARKQASMFDEQRKLLEEAIQSDPSDGDVLIAMHRFKQADEAFKKKTLTLIEAAIEHHRIEIELYENAYRISGDAERETAKRKLAGANNQFAWLASNTIGDYKEAVRCSLKSLELRPGSSSYLDTLGHCYYAAGNYAEAVKTQQQAINIDPSSQQMLRMLKVFQDALAKSQEKE